MPDTVEELRGARESEARVKGQLAELQRKEQYHIMRLSCKEHELQEMGVSHFLRTFPRFICLHV